MWYDLWNLAVLTASASIFLYVLILMANRSGGKQGGRPRPERGSGHLRDVDMMSGSSPRRLVPNEGRSNGDSSSSSSIPRSLEDEKLKYGAQHVIKLFIPVSVSMLIVVASITSLKFYQKSTVHLLYTPFNTQDADTPTIVWESFANALIFLTVIIVMTFVLILLYKYKFYKIIGGWLILSSLMLLFLFMYIYMSVILRTFNLPMDIITVSLLNWNFGVIGMICIHWKGPLRLQQAYLLTIAALMALLLLKYIPEWTVWVVLGVVSVWDLVAVLCPKGPLRMLVETAQSRNESIFPSLIYSSAMVYMADEFKSSTQSDPIRVGSSEHDMEIDNREAEQSRRRPRLNETRNPAAQGSSEPPQVIFSRDRPHPEMMMEDDDDDEKGVKLGLGDFIFYSVLVGKASSYGDWSTTVACFVAILIGLCLTLLLLAFFKKALPALPISIFFGLTFYFATSSFVAPFCSRLMDMQIFI
ncbi:presenilin-1-like [Brevipalpus obovatus]|uniref:presenilin-1-like n=1 Tax=Brevipalpus obovatus TaxID=246614 RepID=UPI003D9E9120